MAGQYAPKTFIRQVRGALLNRCLRQYGIEADLNIEIIKPAVVETIFQRLMAVPPEQLHLVERDFATITELASREGAEALLMQAAHAGVDFSTLFAQARNDYERACWAFLEHRDIFELAACFHAMDHIGAGRWRRRWVGENLVPATDAQAIQMLQSLMRATYAKEGRGRRCHVDYYMRHEPTRHCFFAYPEDHLRTDLGYDEDDALRDHPRKVAFEVIFVYRPEEGVLEVMAPGGKDQVKDLAACFCAAILGVPELPEKSLPRVFDLERLKQPDVTFPTDPEDAIELVQLREVKLTLPKRHGWRRRVQFSADARAHDPATTHQMLVETVQLANVPLEDVIVSHARFCLIFAPPDGTRPRHLVFTVSTPDICNLKDGHHDNIARKYLRRWGLVVDESAAKVHARSGSASRAGLLLR